MDGAGLPKFVVVLVCGEGIGAFPMGANGLKEGAEGAPKGDALALANGFMAGGVEFFLVALSFPSVE